MRSLLLLALSLSLLACGDDDKPPVTPAADMAADPDMAAPDQAATPDLVEEDMADVDMAPMLTEADALRIERRGPHAVGNATFSLVDSARADRPLTVEVWYPAAAAGAGEPVERFVAEGEARDLIAPLIAAAPDKCVVKMTGSTRDAAPLDAASDPKRPLILFSHCHSCTRWSKFTIAEHLASHGFIVVAPDHTGNTLFDELKGQSAEVDKVFQATRAADIRLVLDAMLDATATTVPASVRGRADADRVAMMGHSYGGATTGLILTQDARVKAGWAIAVPLASGVLLPANMSGITQPTGFLLAVQDNSISEVGNRLIRDNHRRATGPSWLIEVADTGHWSFSTIAGIIDGFAPGCGEGMTQTSPRGPLTYLDNQIARDLAAAYTLAFFQATLLDDAAARLYLATPRPAAHVEVSAR